MMHKARLDILSGKPVGQESPLVKKQPKGTQRGEQGSLANLVIQRGERRKAHQRQEDRYRLRDEKTNIYFRGRVQEVELLNLSTTGAMIQTDLMPNIGERIPIEFSDCNRITCAVRWVRGGRIGLEFMAETELLAESGVEEYVIDKINSIEKAANPLSFEDRRNRRSRHDRETRHGLVWTGEMRCEDGAWTVRLRNISPGGAMVAMDGNIDVGMEVVLDLGDAGTVDALVRWTRGGEVGLKFRERFDLSLLAREAPEHIPEPEWCKPQYLEDESKAAPEDRYGGRSGLTLQEIYTTLRGNKGDD